ncbi:hypothetical protein ACWGE1_12210 [Streptomyces sp. NPDC054932]
MSAVIRTFRYRLRSPLGQLAADLSARIVPPGEAAAFSVVIHRGVRLLLPEARLYREDLAEPSTPVAGAPDTMEQSPARHIGELAVTGIDFLASFLRTGRLHGIGIGSTLGEVDRAIRHRFVDVVDEEGESLRRDYGFVEFYFNPGDEWVMSGGSIELHRLASGRGMAREWARTTGVGFPRHVAWADVREELGRVPGAPELTVGDQGGFLEYRAAASNVSVIVVDDEEEERGSHVGHGDVWSVSLWAPVRAK